MGRTSRGKPAVALAVLCWALGCGAPDATRPPRSGRALASAAWAPMKLLPAASVAPLPPRDAPAFERAAPAIRALSIGTTGRGALLDGIALQASDALALRPISVQRGAIYGASGLVGMLTRAAERVAREHPGSVLWAGDLSLAEGGPLAPHASHTSGRDVDLAFYVTRADAPADGPEMRYVAPDGRVAGTDLRFDAARNWALVRALLEDPQVVPQWIFCASHVRALLLSEAQRAGADPLLVAKAERVLAQPGDSSPHDDHFHVRVYCGLAERLQGCLDAPPWHPWAPRWEAELARWAEALAPFLATPSEPETREAIERIVRMNATGALPDLKRLAAGDSSLAPLAADAVDFLEGRRTPDAWRRWRAEDTAP